MTARPVPQRIAGYEPNLLAEPGRVPERLTVGKPPPVPTTSYPPHNPVFIPRNIFNPPPPVIVPPVVPPPPTPTCPDGSPPDENGECPNGEPPVDVPEPGMIILLITGILVTVFVTRRGLAQ